jgi:hypothetical protein
MTAFEFAQNATAEATDIITRQNAQTQAVLAPPSPWAARYPGIF